MEPNYVDVFGNASYYDLLGDAVNPYRFFIDFHELNKVNNRPEKLIKLAKEDGFTREYLFKIIQASAENVLIANAAGNAITILKLARISFEGKVFIGVKICGADMRGAVANNANFDNSRLYKVKFFGAQLLGATFNNSKGATFTDEPDEKSTSPQSGSFDNSLEKLFTYDSTVDLKKLFTYFNKISHQDSSQITLLADNELSDQELENLCTQLIGDAVYFFNNSDMDSISKCTEETKKLPIPHQYAKAVMECSRGNIGALKQLIEQGVRLDKPILSICHRSTSSPMTNNTTDIFFVREMDHKGIKTLQVIHLVDDANSKEKKMGSVEEKFMLFSYPKNEFGQNFQLFYHLMLWMFNSSGYSDPSPDTIHFICDLFYEKKINSFLQVFNHKTGASLEIRKDKKYLSPTDYIEGYAYEKPHPAIILKGYEILYPEYQELISTIVERVDKIANEQGLFSNVTKETLEKYKAFLRLALYQNGQLQQVLKQAHQQKWLVKPFSKLNLINLLIPLALALENREFSEKLMLAIEQFDNNSYKHYKQILQILGTKIQEALVSKGMTCNWYDQMTQKLSLFKTFPVNTSLSLPVVPSISPTNSISSIPANVVLPTVFPLKDLKNLLDFLQEINLEEILEKGVNGEIEKLFKGINYFLKLDEKLDDSLVRILAANLTFGAIYSICSKSEISLSNVYKFGSALMFGEDILKPSEELYGRKLSGIMTSATQLYEYFNAFYIQQGKENILDYDSLVMRLLTDKLLYEFLKNDLMKKRLARLASSVNIPEFDQQTIEKALDIFIQLQKVVLDLPQKEKISGIADLAKHLLYHKSEELANMALELLELMKKMKKIIGIFLEPQIYDIQLLSYPIVKELLQRDSVWIPEKIENIQNPEITEKFLNCEKKFKNYHNEKLGVLVKDPIVTHIRNRICDLYYFTGKGEEWRAAVKNALCIDVKQFYFKEFSFKRSHFHNFNFTQTCFENSDFSDAAFSGTITFSKTYMDSSTAKTFLSALHRAIIHGGDFQIAGKKGIILFNQKETKKNELQSIPEELIEYVDTQYIDWLLPETYIPIFEKQKWPSLQNSSKGSSINSSQNIDQPDSPSIMDSLWGGLEAIADQVTGTAITFVQEFKNYCTGSMENHTAAVRKNNEEEISDHDEIIKELNKLKENMRMQQVVNVHLDNTQENLRIAVEEHQLMINNINDYVNQLQIEKSEKVQIQLEQKKLLRRNDQVTAYYQTFLTELCSSLQAILILQNRLKLIQPDHAKITKISNKQNKCGRLLETAKRDPNKVEKAYQWMMALKDQVVGVAEYAKPLLSLIPYGIGNACNKGVDLLQKANDQTKLSHTKAAYRGLTVKTLEKMADAIARKITFAYKEQILLLSSKGAIQFAECGVLRVVAALLNNYIESSDQFATQAWLAIRGLRADQNAKFLGIEIPFTHRKLDAKNQKDHFTEDALYRRPGIAYKKKKNEYVYFSNDKKNGQKSPFPDAVVTKAHKLGYMLVSKGEWEKYFRQSVTLDNKPLVVFSSRKQNNTNQHSIQTNAPVSEIKPTIEANHLPVARHLILDQGKILDKLAEQEKLIKKLMEDNEMLKKRQDNFEQVNKK